MKQEIEGQLNLFDILNAEPDFETMSTEAAVQLIQERTGLKFKHNERFKSYIAKKKGYEVEINGFNHYAEGVRDERRFLDMGISKGKWGSGRPIESIDEAVEYIHREIDKCNVSEEKAAEPKCTNAAVDQTLKEPIQTEWIDISSPPKEGQFCKFEYKWSMNSKNDSRGQCTGWWKNGKVNWLNMPFDIGKKELIKWKPEEEPKEEEEPVCTKAAECEAYPEGCGGTIEPCRFGGPYQWSKEDCKYFKDNPKGICTHDSCIKHIKANRLNLNITCNNDCCYECQDKCRYRCYVVRAEESKKE